jgi:hypothetical protein
VRFVDREYDLGSLDLPTYDDYKTIANTIPQPTRAEAHAALEASIRANARPGWRVDDSMAFQAGSRWLHATPHPASLLIDDHVAGTLGLHLITNGQTSLYSKRCVAAEVAAQLTQYAVAEALPNLQSLEGPYHPVLDDLRSMRSVRAFRAKAEEWSAGKSGEDLPKMRAELDADFRDFTARAIGEKVGRWNLFLAAADLVIGNVPVLSSIWGNLKGAKDLADAIKSGRTHGWAAFVASARARAPHSAGAERPFPKQPAFAGNGDHLAVLRHAVEHGDIWGWNEWIGRKQGQGSGSLHADPGEDRPEPGPVELAGIDLTGTDLYGINLGSVDLRKAKLSSTTLDFARFRFANLEEADLRDATLKGASFEVANLTGADLRGLDLREVDFAGATLTGAQLGGAILAARFKMDDEGRVPYWS